VRLYARTHTTFCHLTDPSDCTLPCTAIWSALAAPVAHALDCLPPRADPRATHLSWASTRPWRWVCAPPPWVQPDRPLLCGVCCGWIKAIIAVALLRSNAFNATPKGSTHRPAPDRHPLRLTLRCLLFSRGGELSRRDAISRVTYCRAGPIGPPVPCASMLLLSRCRVVGEMSTRGERWALPVDVG